MLAQGAVGALNHLLTGSNWARERLRAFAGQHARLAGGPIKLDLVVDGEGYFRRLEGPADTAPAVTIELPADAPFRFVLDRNSVFAAARLSGTADFAETLAFVFRNLRWDVEEDLARFVGDIAAHRLVRAGEALVGWQKRAGANLAANAAEYLGEESGMLVPRREMAGLATETERLRAELAELERRLARLA
ncbi:MAG TPA: hypothetical protein VJ576_08045 [Rhodocyclaceae bacterium]|nr:hypothetical protein [Rhodocyclaceae bacterium]